MKKKSSKSIFTIGQEPITGTIKFPGGVTVIFNSTPPANVNAIMKAMKPKL